MLLWEHGGELRDLLTNQRSKVLVTLENHLVLLVLMMLLLLVLLLMQLLQVLMLEAGMIEAVVLPLFSLRRAPTPSNHGPASRLNRELWRF